MALNTQKETSYAVQYANPLDILLQAPTKVFDPGVELSEDYIKANKPQYEPLRACPICGGTHWPYGDKAAYWHPSEDGFTFQINFFNEYGKQWGP